HRQVVAVQAGVIADVGDWRPEGNREAAPDLDLVQSRVVVDHIDVLDGRCENSGSRVQFASGGGDRTHFVIAHDGLVAGEIGGNLVSRPELESGCSAYSVDW